MPRIFMISLGCAKNLVDAETMLGETLDDEFSLALEPGDADVVVVNTCGFIENAREEARQVFGELLKLRGKGRNRQKIVAAGCWAQRDPEGLLKEFPGLDAVWGLAVESSLKDQIRALKSAPIVAGIGNSQPTREGARLLTTTPSFAYLRLSDGCDNRCNYCAIPLIRGGLRSREPQAVLDEAKVLADMGAQEIILISQDTTAYGHDLKRPGTDLADLTETLLKNVDVPRIRILYAHPAHLDDRVIGLLRNEPRLCGYLDLPVQHAAGNVLARMGRGYGKERILEIIDKLGPDFTLRTTLLLGFPGESEADFQEAVELVRAGHFRQLGAFAYSPEPGTPAFDFPGQVPEDVAHERWQTIMRTQEKAAFDWLDSRVGEKTLVLVDSRADDDLVIGRSRHEAPDADGSILLRDGEHEAGDMVMACITRRSGYDLEGKPETAREKQKRAKNPKRKRK